MPSIGCAPLSSYTPFLIANFKTGLELDLEPWLLPQDAFMELQNAYIRNGVLMKRNGYTEFADTGDARPIMGIFNYVESNNSKTLLVADTDRLFEYAAGILNDLDLADVWTSVGADLCSSINWKGSLYMTNFKDQIRVFNGTTVTNYKIDINGDTTNDVGYCRHLVIHKERLIALYTYEGAAERPQRARWCVAGNVTDWTNDGYVDCPTSDFITAAVLIGDDILVWFSSSIWWLKYTADPDLPFRWERIDSETGSQAPYVPVLKNNRSYGFDKSGLVVTDGFDVVPVDQKIPDFGLTFNQTNINNCYGILINELRQIWIAYPDASSTTNTRVLAYNYEENSWAVFTIPFTCFGYYSRQESLTYDDATWAIDSSAERIDAQAAQEGYPTIIGGKTNGKIYTLNDGTDDDGSDIEMIVTSKRWNPYKDQGLKARLGWIDFLVTCREEDELSVDFFTDFKTLSYQTKILSFDQEGQKAWVRLFSGAVGNTHRIKMYHTASGQQPKIHAIMPWFKPAGRLSL